MKIRSLAVNQFKKFTSPSKLEDIRDGLNALVGPNEMGKSTLLDALRAVLFEKHNSNTASIRNLQNERNKAAPVVELRFELESGLYSISKRFLKKPYARLHLPDGSVREGDDAENALHDLLKFPEPGRKAAMAETMGMWNVLWAKQGVSFGNTDLSESARASLHDALESQVGTVLGGERGRQLPQAIEKQRLDLVTKTGKPRGEYKAATDEIARLEQELEELKRKRTDLSDTLRELEEEEKRLKRLSDPGREKEDRKKLDEARGRRDRLEKLEYRTEAAERELKIRELRLEQAKQKEKQRRGLKKEVAGQKSALEELGEKLEETSGLENHARIKVEELEAAERTAEAAEREAKDAVSTKSRILNTVESGNRIDGLAGQLEKARAAERREKEARERLENNSVTQEMLERIEDAEKEMEKAENRLSAVSTLITFEMENPHGVKVDGEPLVSGKDSRRAVSPAVITVPERGKITVEPAIENRDELLGRRAEAEKLLKDLLAEVGVSTVKEARNLYSERQKASEKAELARREAELYAPEANEHGAGAQALSDYIEKRRQTVETEMKKLGLSELPEHEGARAALRESQDESETARKALDGARAALRGPREALDEIQRELTSAKTRYDECGKQLGKLAGQLEKAEGEHTEDNLLEETEAARKAVSDQKAELSQLREESGGGDTLDQAEARVKRLEKSIEERRSAGHELERSISSRKSRVEILEGAGLDEDIERKERILELRRQECGRFKREEQVLSLLLKTLRNAERKAKELYLSPVTERMRPYLRFLFPGSDIKIDEDLHITGVIREEEYEEPFPLLSMGTQEQIAILVRLAFAEMLVEQGSPATVILDDVLVFSDDTRMPRMFDILNMAANKIQILIFTCHEQTFEDIGAHLLSLRDGDPEDLISA